MTLNTQNSFLISAFLHLLFIAVFIAMPKSEYKPEYKVNQLIDISFLFSTIEKEPQANKKPGDKPVLKSKVEPMETPHPAPLPKGEREFSLQNAKDTAIEASREKIVSEALQKDSLRVKEKEINQEYQKAHSSLGQTVGMPIEQKTETLTYGTSGSSVSVTSDLPSSYASTAKGDGISDIKTSGFAGSKDTAASAHTGTAIDKSAIISSFVDRIELLKHYPYIARRRGIQGTALIFVHLNKNGELKDVVLRKSSGHEILDKSAVELIKKATPFRHGYYSDLKIEIPITYKLMR
jgi:TonB family protein